jgi:hypothetical protein
MVFWQVTIGCVSAVTRSQLLCVTLPPPNNAAANTALILLAVLYAQPRSLF